MIRLIDHDGNKVVFSRYTKGKPPGSGEVSNTRQETLDVIKAQNTRCKARIAKERKDRQ